MKNTKKELRAICDRLYLNYDKTTSVYDLIKLIKDRIKLEPHKQFNAQYLLNSVYNSYSQAKLNSCERLLEYWNGVQDVDINGNCFHYNLYLYILVDNVKITVQETYADTYFKLGW